MAAAYRLRSLEFRREREAGWKELEKLVALVEDKGIAELAPEELERLPGLYRAAISSLSVARAISLDRNLVDYLEGLSRRAYLCVYGTKRAFLPAIVEFYRTGYPRRIRKMGGALLLSLAILAAGTVTGLVLTRSDPDRFFGLVSEDMAGSRGPFSTREELAEVLRRTAVPPEGEEETDPGLGTFSSYLFTNNAQIGLLCFTLGALGGVPVILLLFGNGLVLGALAAIHVPHGLSVEFWGWVLPHGVTELLAVAICGAAGLTLADRWMRPGPLRRVDALARAGREAGAVVVGTVLPFLVAGLIEGYFRQLVVDPTTRWTVAVASAIAWIAYLAPRRPRPLP